MSDRYVCIHAHFYQPPRENPWLEEVEVQDSAYPYHDWNERIAAECYAPNTASRILDGDGRIVDIVNNYSRVSFNFGPTLLSWMERHRPAVLEALGEADRLSRDRFGGHGAAIAQVYNHQIMPLATERDRYTQAIWGLRDFERRFGREAEGMWLPETAANAATLDVLADLGLRFTVLAPRQARRFRAVGEDAWTDANGGIDPTRPYVVHLPSGRSIVAFFYDGPVSRALAFEGLLNSGEAFAGRLLGAFSDERAWPQLVHIATDGESYGHHHARGDMALAYCLHQIEAAPEVDLTVYGAYLAAHPPTHEAEIWDDSSWSCVHGVERWRSDCGCNSGGRPGWDQAWRAPLRTGLDDLRDRLAPLYEEQASQLLGDPWAARDAYVDCILDRSPASVDRFLAAHARRTLTPDERVRVLKLLEMQRHAMLMFTSCAWFFDEISGIETTQVLGYAMRAIQLAQDLTGIDAEPAFLERLADAPSNLDRFANGAEVFAAYVRPTRLDLPQVAAHFAINTLFERSIEDVRIYCHDAQTSEFERFEAGAIRLAVGRTRMDSLITGDSRTFRFAALHWGDHNVVCGVDEHLVAERFESARETMRAAATIGDIPKVVRLIDETFADGAYTLFHLFRDEQQAVLKEILAAGRAEARAAFRDIIARQYPTMNYLAEIGRPLPREFATAAEFVVNEDLRELLEDESLAPERLHEKIDDIERWSVPIDRAGLGLASSNRINELMGAAARSPRDGELLARVLVRLRELRRLGLDLNLWEAQNTYFRLARTLRAEMAERAGAGDEGAARWVDVFDRLADPLSVRVL